MKDKQRTPFNIGKAIPLQGLGWEEAQPLADGLKNYAEQPSLALKIILGWTGGQPFLTQKLCQLIVLNSDYIKAGEEATKIETIVRTHIMNNWEANDEPEHLRTIRDRLLYNEQRTVRRLSLYKEILTSPVSTLLHHRSYFPKEIPTGIPADNSVEQTELLLSGVTVRENGFITVCNPIYEAVFNLDWIEEQLLAIRPYNSRIQAWLKSACQDESPLLQGSSLTRAQEWADGKSLSNLDYQFLAASQLSVSVKSAISQSNQSKKSSSPFSRKWIKWLPYLIIGFIFVLVLGFSWQQFNQEKKEAKISEIEAYNLLAESYLSSQQSLDAMIAALKAADTLQEMETSPPLTERSKLLLGRSIAQFSNSEEIPDGSLEELIQNSCSKIETYLESNPNKRIRLEGKIYILEKEDICD